MVENATAFPKRAKQTIDVLIKTMVDKGSAKMETERIVLPNSDDEDDSANEANNSDSEEKRHGECRLSDDHITSRQPSLFCKLYVGVQRCSCSGC